MDIDTWSSTGGGDLPSEKRGRVPFEKRVRRDFIQEKKEDMRHFSKKKGGGNLKRISVGSDNLDHGPGCTLAE